LIDSYFCLVCKYYRDLFEVVKYDDIQAWLNQRREEKEESSGQYKSNHKLNNQEIQTEQSAEYMQSPQKLLKEDSQPYQSNSFQETTQFGPGDTSQINLKGD